MLPYPDNSNENTENVVCSPIAEYCKTTARRQLTLFDGYNCTSNEKTESNSLRVVELFAGVGGFRVGLERASKRFKTIWSNQWEPSTKRQDASIVYCRNFGNDGHCNRDIATVDALEIPDADIFCGGFPCQDYSVATTLKNSGGIEGKKGVLWWQICRLVMNATHKPRFLILENVDRLLKSPATQRGRDFAIILASLAELGYCAEWRVINAADYGMPQRRIRTYIVAYRDDTALADNLRNSEPVNWLIDEGIFARAFTAKIKSREKPRESSFVITGDLPEISRDFNAMSKGAPSPFLNAGLMTGRKVYSLDTEACYEGPHLTLSDIIVPDSEVPDNYFISEDMLPKWKYFKGSKSETRISPQGFTYKYSEGAMSFPDALDKPSRTIITGEGGESPSRFKHVILTPSGRYRRLIPLELERLNMFPDNHTAGVTDGRRAFLMGNALVTGIVEAIGRQLILSGI